MRETLEKIFAAEEEGRRLIAEARLRARDIAAGAARKAAALSGALLEEARARAARELAAARAAALEEKRAALSAAAAAAERDLPEDGALLARLAEEAAREAAGP